MANDLMEFHDRIEFCRAEAAALERLISAWAATGIRYRRRPFPHVLSVRPEFYAVSATQIGAPPTALRSKVGMIANELRSCLDGLACTLADRHSNSHKNTYFPISKSEEIFNTDGRQKMRLLSPDDQNTIAALKPYRGGNPILFGLHELDRSRKHIKLSSAASVAGFALGRNGAFTLINGGDVIIQNGNIDGIPIDKIRFRETRLSQTGTEITVAENIPVELPAQPLPSISFTEPEELVDVDIMIGLNDMTSLISEIVSRFD